jgi:hypothetical protein
MGADEAARPHSYAALRALGPAARDGGLAYRLDLTAVAADLSGVASGWYSCWVEAPTLPAACVMKIAAAADADALADAVSGGAGVGLLMFNANLPEMLEFRGGDKLRARLTAGTGILRLVRVL